MPDLQRHRGPRLSGHVARRFISLRRQEPDGRETEIGIIRDLEQWPAAVRAAVRASAERRQVLRRIEEVRQVRTCGNALEMAVVTADGEENIRMEKSGESLQRYGRRGLLADRRQRPVLRHSGPQRLAQGTTTIA